VCANAFRVQDAAAAYKRALELGAWGFDGHSGPMELNIPAIKGVGDSLLYLVDRWRGKDGAPEGAIGNISIYDVDFEPLPGAPSLHEPVGHGLTTIDHLTHNVHRGRMAEWASFYERLFNFREVRYFDIEGQVTGVKSKAMTSPCGLIRIPINEEGKEKAGQIQEYLDAYHGEGIQHIALSSTDLFKTVDAMRAQGIGLLDTPDTYYELIDRRIPGHGQPIAELQQRKILVDGTKDALLLQIFTENQLGPIFFEFIQRLGNEGFGEGNFKALFESIELDQMRRGTLAAS
jgi:4-hydroxyphenylpyruvate dioxygenase